METTSSTAETPDTRAAGGRFAKGNRGGPGNPFARQTARLRQAALDATSPEDIRDIFDALKKKALEGDVPAAKLVLSYTVGKPVVTENPDTLDQQEFKTMMANTLDSAEGPLNIIKGMPLDLLVEMFRLILPAMRSQKAQLAREVLTAPLTEEEIEDNEDDDDADEESATSANSRARGASKGMPDDPLANIPDWMLRIGKEKPAPRTKAKRRQPTPAPVEAAEGRTKADADAELLHLLLQRAHHLAESNGDAAGPDVSTAESIAAFLKMARAPGEAPPSANGSNGRHSPSANGADGTK
jgi:hypothetical protein